MSLELTRSTILPVDILTGPLETLVNSVVDIYKNGQNRDIRIAEIINDRECYIIQIKTRLETFHREVDLIESQLIKDHELLMYKAKFYASELENYNSMIFNKDINDSQRNMAKEMYKETALKLESLKRPQLENKFQSIQYRSN